MGFCTRSGLGLLLTLGNLLLPPLSSSEPVRVGVILGETGAAAKWARAQREGLMLAREQFAGEKIELLFEDSASDATRAIAAFHKLVDLKNVDYIIGDVFSQLTEALIPLLKSRRVVLLSPSSPHSSCHKDIPNFFTISAQIPRSSAAWESALKAARARRIALVYLDIPTWGALYAENWRQAARALGVEVIAEFSNTDLVATDFRSIMPRLLAQKPDTILLAHDALGFFRAAREVRFEGNVISANHILEHLPDPAVARLLDGALVVDSPPSEEFRIAFRSRFGHPPLLEPQTSYEALHAILVASRSTVQDLRQLSYSGVAGPVDFRASCAGNYAHWKVFRIEKGILQQVIE